LIAPFLDRTEDRRANEALRPNAPGRSVHLLPEFEQLGEFNRTVVASNGARALSCSAERRERARSRAASMRPVGEPASFEISSNNPNADALSGSPTRAIAAKALTARLWTVRITDDCLQRTIKRSRAEFRDRFEQ
jgi:hypothetical protein